MIWLLTLIVTATVGVTSGQTQHGVPYYADLLPGSYCAARTDIRQDLCCNNRVDDCSVAILGTRCYCDEFCDRGTRGDCCPDYFTFCRGLPPPTTPPPPQPLNFPCRYKGRIVKPNATLIDNCNLCTCSVSGISQPEMMCARDTCLVQPDLIEVVNSSPAYGWRAANYTDFWGKKLSEGVQRLLGTRYPKRMMRTMFPIVDVYRQKDLPRTFDARNKWRGAIGAVQDQGWCSSSWAVSTASVSSDRLAIQTRAGRHRQLSVQNIVDCAFPRRTSLDKCEAGNLDRAWNYVRKYGISESTCYRYESGTSRKGGTCLTPRRSRDLFQLTCVNGSVVYTTRDLLHTMSPPYRIATNQDSIRYEIYKNGPVQAILRVKADFFWYRSGVYRSSGLISDDSINSGYHSVRLLGWGEDYTDQGSLKYWLAANSWGAAWGEQGLFRIVRGENHMDIEAFVVGAWAKPHSKMAAFRRTNHQHRRHNRKTAGGK